MGALMTGWACKVQSSVRVSHACAYSVAGLAVLEWKQLCCRQKLSSMCCGISLGPYDSQG